MGYSFNTIINPRTTQPIDIPETSDLPSSSLPSMQESLTTTDKNGQAREIHFYKNSKTAQIDYETIVYKVKGKIKQ